MICGYAYYLFTIRCNCSVWTMTGGGAGPCCLWKFRCCFSGRPSAFLKPAAQKQHFSGLLPSTLIGQTVGFDVGGARVLWCNPALCITSAEAWEHTCDGAGGFWCLLRFCRGLPSPCIPQSILQFWQCLSIRFMVIGRRWQSSLQVAVVSPASTPVWAAQCNCWSVCILTRPLMPAMIREGTVVASRLDQGGRNPWA